MKHVLTYCPYVPEPWVKTHGCELVRLKPSGKAVHDSVACVEGLCPYAQAWVSDVLQSDPAQAIVMTTCCDQMRRAFELVEQVANVPCFLMNLPKVWQRESAFASYQEELRRLGRFLDRLPDNECAVTPSFKEKKTSVPRHDSVPLALVGSHGLEQDERLKALIEQLGGCITLDTTEPTLPVQTPGETFDAMSRAYWETLNDVSQRPNTRLYERLGSLMGQTRVAGVIVRRYLWCDLWHAEVARIKAWSNVPVLDIEISSPTQMDQHRLATRIQAFMEMIA
jgi:benzoyl-CoA reductase/2-hydroxyglutaryl-CoA dehydratase subunit BcrC/BadD/HgdB